ncbi:hypothetical protein CMV_007655 [Castanea mollissima]|uniref:Uncharacterized protein n=1 Tax=Castanea mollissima TaxID=60419 RepID=A0A8J4RLG0_9ROSI|nr:hypothetical protein CMV_007655 [Castanea mollissima]
MDEWSWASKMGEEDDKSGRRWCVSFSGGGEEDDESMRLMDKEDDESMSSDLLAALNTQPDVAIVVTDDDEGLEASSLIGTGLLLNRHDLHDLVLETRAELVHDLELLDWEGVKVDLLQGSYLIGMDEASELRDWHPLLLLLASPAAASTASTVSSGASSTKASAEATALSSCSAALSHDF